MIIEAVKSSENRNPWILGIHLPVGMQRQMSMLLVRDLVVDNNWNSADDLDSHSTNNLESQVTVMCCYLANKWLHYIVDDPILSFSIWYILVVWCSFLLYMTTKFFQLIQEKRKERDNWHVSAPQKSRFHGTLIKFPERNKRYYTRKILFYLVNVNFICCHMRIFLTQLANHRR